MAALTSPLFVVLFACSWIFVLCQGTQELKVTVNAGEDATLQCRSHGGADITVIKWSRTDLKSDDGFVFYLRPDQINGKEYQNLLFQGRVELLDPKMKNGNASVILKNVNINDTGTYECRVKEKNESGKPKLNSTIRLTVTEPGHTAGHKEGGDKEGGAQEPAGGQLPLVHQAAGGQEPAGGQLPLVHQVAGGQEPAGGQLPLVHQVAGGQEAAGGQEPAGGQERNVGLTVGLPVGGIFLLLLGVGGFVIFKKYRGRTEKEQTPAEEAEKQSLHSK